MNVELQTASLHALLARHRAGDRRALDDLIRRTSQRLERLARKMLGQFPAVRAREESGDVLQSALIRLTRALGDVTPQSVRDYYGLAAEQIRRELLDLARRHALRPSGRLVETEVAGPATRPISPAGRLFKKRWNSCSQICVKSSA